MAGYFIADDLSGAIEAAAAWRMAGWRVRLPLQAERWTHSDRGGITAVSTETRNLSPGEATAIVRQWTAQGDRLGATLRFKKIDSTLRGPIAAELLALPPGLVVFCPAHPAAGRTVLGGLLRVHGIPVAETAFRHDPGWPVTTSDIAALLRAGGLKWIRQLPLAELRAGATAALNAAVEDGVRVMVADAETLDDLATLAAAARHCRDAQIFVGSAALAAAHAAANPPPQPVLPVEKWPPGQRVLFVCGSRHEVSHRQIDRLRIAGVPVGELGGTDLPDEANCVGGPADVAMVGSAALRLSRRLDAEAAARVLRSLGELVHARLQDGAFEVLVATGGETAYTLCRALEVTALRPEILLEPGVVACRIEQSRAPGLRWLITKPGGFGTDDTWLRMIAHGASE